MAAKAPRKRKPIPGAKLFPRIGYYVEGRFFADQLEHACAFAGRLCAQYDRLVAVDLALFPGHSRRTLAYVPEDSIDAFAGRRDAHGYVIVA